MEHRDCKRGVGEKFRSRSCIRVPMDPHEPRGRSHSRKSSAEVPHHSLSEVESFELMKSLIVYCRETQAEFIQYVSQKSTLTREEQELHQSYQALILSFDENIRFLEAQIHGEITTQDFLEKQIEDYDDAMSKLLKIDKLYTELNDEFKTMKDGLLHKKYSDPGGVISNQLRDTMKMLRGLIVNTSMNMIFFNLHPEEPTFKHNIQRNLIGIKVVCRWKFNAGLRHLGLNITV